MQKFDKAMLKKEIENNARKLFRRELTELNEKELSGTVLADALCFGELKGYSRDWDINGEELSLSVEKQ